MPFVKTNKSKGHEYYTISESYRDGGKVKHRMLEYIGDISALKNYALKGYLFMKAHRDSEKEGDSTGNKSPPEVPFLKTYAHGSSAALLLVADFLGIQDILDQEFPGKTIKGLSRGTLITLAAIQRAIKPGSKRSFASWAETTSLPYLVGFDACNLTSQAFWEAMDNITEEQFRNAWRRIVKVIIRKFSIKFGTFHLDYTNYFTWINTKNGRCLICRRGHNKQKRDDLLQFCVAALTAIELQIPIIWEVYEGNKNDKSEFADFADLITKELPYLGVTPGEITIAFDGGSNSEENFNGLAFNILCAHSINGHKDLLDIDINDYETYILSNGKERLGYYLEEIEFSGQKGSGILTFSDALLDGQVAELERDLSRTQDVIKVMNERLCNPRSRLFTELEKEKKETARIQHEAVKYNEMIEKEEETRKARGIKRKGAQKKPKPIPIWDELASLKGILEKYVYSSRSYLKQFTDIQLIHPEGDDKIYQVMMTIDNVQKEEYIRKHYGKKLTTTNHLDWTPEMMLERYADQECIENSIFRTSKDTDHFAVRPQYHYTDDKIIAHTFCCMLALAMGEVLRMLLEEKNVSLTKTALLDQLDMIRDGWIVLGDLKTVRRVLEHMDNELKRIWNALLEALNVGSDVSHKLAGFRRKAKRHRTRITVYNENCNPEEVIA